MYILLLFIIKKSVCTLGITAPQPAARDPYSPPSLILRSSTTRRTPAMGLAMMIPRFADFLGCLALNLIGVGALCGSASLMPAAPATAMATTRIGSMMLERCAHVAAYCGRLDRPLDPTGAMPGRISIYFEFYPHRTQGRSEGTLVATEGGPGYPATLSREAYLALFKPLRQSRDVVLMDNRGTGKSGAIDCRALQTSEKWTVQSVAACGESLGDRAALYSTAYAADDLAAILDALGVRQIDLYGDSYGTYFEQVFAVRHPDALRSIVLDGAYALDGPDYAWYPTYAPAMREKFNIACRRSKACAELGGSSIEHIAPLIERLRTAPFTAHAAVGGGERVFTADAALLATVMFAGAPDFVTVRELDAAARAFMNDDRAPLLRLIAETLSGVDSRDPTADATKWSAGLAAAVMCQDPPQIFDMRLAPEPRAADRDRAVAERQRAFPDTYAPFTIDEYRAMPLDYSFLDQCVAWPVSPPSHPASHVVAADAAYPDIPALILSGELDNITTMADGEAVAKAFKHGRQVRLANSFHVNALPRARSACGAEIVRRFIATLEPGDVGCAAAVPAVHLVPRFARKVAQLEPAVGLNGNSADGESLKWVSATVLTAGDLIARFDSNTTDEGQGLRGGSFRFTPHGQSVRITLRNVRWTEDVAVSGTIDTSREPMGPVRARLAVKGPSGLAGRLTIQWQDGGPEARALVRGTIGGAAVVAQTPAP
jgi:pimeloyl-ACP methyl ester carboxylesterase